MASVVDTLVDTLRNLNPRNFNEFAIQLQLNTRHKGKIFPGFSDSGSQDPEGIVRHLLLASSKLEVYEVVVETLRKISCHKEAIRLNTAMERIPELKLDKLSYMFVEKVSAEVLNQLLDDLLSDSVLNGHEKISILEKNPTARRAHSLIDMVMMKGPGACRRMLTHLELRDPALFDTAMEWSPVWELDRLRYMFVEKVSEEVLIQLLEDLLSDSVLNDHEKISILEKNPTTASRAHSLIAMVMMKGPGACRRMLTHLQHKDPALVAMERSPEWELERLRYIYVEKVSSEVLNQLLDDLLSDSVLDGHEKISILEKNPTRASRARSLIDMVLMKGPRACRRMLNHLERRDPALVDTAMEKRSPEVGWDQSTAAPFLDVYPSDSKRFNDQLCPSVGGHHFVDTHKFQLIQRVRQVEDVLLALLTKGVIGQKSYDEIRALHTSQEKMKKLLDGQLKSIEDKDILYSILQKMEPYLLEEIEKPKTKAQSGFDVSSQESFENVEKKMVKREMFPEWTELEPEVTCLEDTSTYSLQSEAGKFECSVSGLRWVCKEKVSFKYHFGSWEEHMERMASMRYMPGGPLLDITVIAGKLDEVYLPHWICTVDNPDILGQFAVLHIDTCGDVVEQVSEVTPSHVKLSKPIFSIRAILITFGFPWKCNCKVFIYKTKKAFLTLHVYLIPDDPALQQALDKKESSHGYKRIEKPFPQNSLKMNDRFVLTADNSAEIDPDTFTLKYESRDPNFIEVFIRNPEETFRLTLKDRSGTEVWSCTIREADYTNTGGEQMTYEQELTRVRSRFVGRVSEEVINQLLDDLFQDSVLNHGEMKCITEKNGTNSDRARCLIDTVIKKGNEASKKMINHLQLRDPTLHDLLRQLACLDT